MPIPKPKKGESEKDFVSRCMAAIGGEYDDNKQAVAVCYDAFRKAKKDEQAEPAEVDVSLAARVGDQAVAGRYEELSPEDLPPHLRRRGIREDDGLEQLKNP